MIKKDKKQKGFSLLEMLVSVSILGIMLSIFAVNYRGANSKSELVGAAQKMASDIRLMQNYGLSLKKFSPTDTEPPAGGWGIYINNASTSYVLFADKNTPNGNKAYDNGEKFREILLPGGITVAPNGILVGGSPVPTSTVIFFPPDPMTYINNSSSTNISITLKEKSRTASVIINSLGLVEAN